MAQRKAEDKEPEKDPERDVIEFMNSVLRDLDKIEKDLAALTAIQMANKISLEDLTARITVIESIPLLAAHIRSQAHNASAAS